MHSIYFTALSLQTGMCSKRTGYKKSWETVGKGEGYESSDASDIKMWSTILFLLGSEKNTIPFLCYNQS